MVKNYLTTEERRIANNHLKIAMGILVAGFILSILPPLVLIGFAVAGVALGYAYGTDSVFRHIDEEREALQNRQAPKFE
jgi:hypothetical protein